ncbi:MAG: aminodeoxychorismate synthase component I [Planctomycetaceae bacterium]|nr:aminodeoxychorismate synthase component I [Planctomycetaceae bacterium]
MFPLVHELDSPPRPAAALAAVSHLPGVLLLESVLQTPGTGQFSFLVAEPWQWFQLQQAEYGLDPFAGIRAAMQGMEAEHLSDLPPFQGGAAGLLSYELGGCFERLPVPAVDEFALPVLAVGLYDSVVAWNHHTGQAWIISQGFPEISPRARKQRAEEQLRRWQVRLDHVNSSADGSTSPDGQTADSPSRHGSSANPTAAAASLKSDSGRASRAAWPVESLPGITVPSALCSNFTRPAYEAAVARVIEHIAAGDIFQANLSQRMSLPVTATPLELYQRLRETNPAPLAGYLNRGDWAVVSSSPERFLQIQGTTVETRPIKGTRGRRHRPEADLFSLDELRESSKDQAENVMIVDLLRNDLSRACRPGTIRVPQLCEVESYQTVQHLVSVVTGELREEATAWDLLAATFPGGSITGAPKVRAMEIIASLEPTVRGPYCGSLFYCGFDGWMDSSILIRTLVHRDGIAHCSAGGGIVAMSSPADEYEETMHKAAGMLQVLADFSPGAPAKTAGREPQR